MDGDAQVPMGQVARRLNVSPERARQLADAGRLGPVMRGPYGDRLVSRAALEAFARERERRGRAVPTRR